MLTEEEIRQIQDEVAKSQNRRAACIEALRLVQSHHGWISDERLQQVAALLGMTAAELDGVATFYNLIFRQPVGRHVILICNSVTCWIKGYVSLLDHLRDRLGIDFGQTTADGRFTLLPIVCLGACDRAPAMMVDGERHDELTPEKINAILAHYE